MLLPATHFLLGGGTCSNISCHQTGRASAPSSTWGGAPFTCYSCHGTTPPYTNYRASAPQYASSYSRGNAHAYHIDVEDVSSDGAGTLGTGTQCKHCHNATTTDNVTIANPLNHADGLYTVGGGTSVFRKWSDGSGLEQSVTMTYAYVPSYYSGQCSNVSCHPPTAKAIKWQAVSQDNSNGCLSCHIITLDGSSSYHHVLSFNEYLYTEYTAPSYPTAIPEGNASSGTNYSSRKCKMCHVDHDIFSHKLNASNTVGRSMNLRTAITVTPDKTSGYTNTDFDNTLVGICISCHSTELEKAASLNQKTEENLPSTKTPAVTKDAFNASAHNYAVPSTMTSGGTFNANCSKCHNAGNNETVSFQTSPYKFKTHDSTFRRLLSPLGMPAPSDPLEENFCFRCHSRISDSALVGGLTKTVSGRDYFGNDGKAMSDDAEYLFMPSAVQTTYTLYFKTIGEEGPSEPMPNKHRDGDRLLLLFGRRLDRAFHVPGGAFISCRRREQRPDHKKSISGFHDFYWKMVTFTSPPASAAITISPGLWTLQIFCKEGNENQNAKVRYRVYKWLSADRSGTQEIIIPSGYAPAEMGLTDDSYMHVQVQVNSSVSLAPGDKISVDFELVTSASDTTDYVADFTFGDGYQGFLAMPSSVPFAPMKGGHTVSAYNDKHRPLPSDDRFSYFVVWQPTFANKHVECGDCHNVHEAGATTHSTGTNAVSSVLKGVSGAVVTSSVTTTLYFRESEPSEPAPNASGNTIDTMGGKWDRKEMLPTQLQGTAPDTSKSLSATIPVTG